MQNTVNKVQIFDAHHINFDPVDSKANAKYPWLDLEVGQSFEFPSGLKFPKPQIYGANQRYAKQGREFVLRKIGSRMFAQRVK